MTDVISPSTNVTMDQAKTVTANFALITPDAVIDVIETLTNLGCITPPGVSNAFTVKVSQAQAAIAAGDIQTAINILSALLQQLQAQAGKHIKTTCTDSRGLPLDPVRMLIEYVTGLLANLGANLKPNFVIGSVLGAGGAEIAGATVTITDGKTIVASATTDITGFYVFPKTSALEIGRNYKVQVTPPKGYKGSTTGSQTLQWGGFAVTLQTFAAK